MAATWTVNNLDRHKSLSGKTDVVFNIHWDCADKDSSGNTGRCYGSIVIPTDDLSDFTAYSDITEAKAVEWAKDALGSDEVNSIEANVANQIAEKATPKQESGVPW
jgi:hypothetical protein|tara:strand:- start:68 stop:385 length:318 start_codon:yes stop_codon:yes gene_type:complete